MDGPEHRAGADFRRRQPSEERRISVFLEQVNPAHVAAQRVQALVTQDLRQFPDARTALRHTGQEPATQAVAGIGNGIQATRRA
jgi:hypothetical protein